ncbi:MAG TPA: STAS/SEC14 domain-containing protein [Anaerolineales bacterium]|nr:STAS/SEC14 domain-containing protein [Anaerolineales bacterium]
MLLQKSPSGAIFPYYYKNGELFGMHLGSYFSNEEGVIAMMKAEETFLTLRHQPIGVWIDFYDTELTDRVIEAFVEMIEHMGPQVTKLAIVGCSFIARWKINKLIKKTELLASLPVKFYEDPEEAKTWLVSELE